MASMMQHVLLLALACWMQFARGDVPGESTVSCNYKEDCILLCKFNNGGDPLVHWKFGPTKEKAFSYYKNQEQPDKQADRFRGRTSLFGDITKGDASLRLKRAELQDEGRFECYTSTIAGADTTVIVLKVIAPPRFVKIHQVGNRITCSAEGVYPRPNLTWSSCPPSSPNATEEPKVLQTEQQLYNISGSVIVPDGESDLSCSCTISARTNKRSATLFRTSVNVSETETTILCTANPPNSPHTKLIWRFNSIEIIVNQTTAGCDWVSEKWNEHVRDVSENGSLILKNPSSALNGLYTCELSTAEEDYVTDTVLQVITPESSSNTGAIIGGVLGAIFLAVVAVVMFLVIRYVRNRRDRGVNNGRRRHNNVQYTAAQGVELEQARNGDAVSQSTES